MIGYNSTWDGGTFVGAPNFGVVMIGSKQFRIRYADDNAGGNFTGETDLNTTGRIVALTAVPQLGSFLTMGPVGGCAIDAVRLARRFGFKALSM
jgi:hypothetical protein